MVDKKRAEVEQRQAAYISVVARDLGKKRQWVASPVAKKKRKGASTRSRWKRLLNIFGHVSMLLTRQRGCKRQNFRKIKSGLAPLTQSFCLIRFNAAAN